MSYILEPIKSAQPLSVTYVARMLLIESAIPVDVGEPVQTREFVYGREAEG
jgi:hypothetical protein